MVVSVLAGRTTGLAGFVPHTANARLSYKYGWFAPYAQWSYVGRNLNSFGTAPQLATDRLERRIVNAGFSLKLPRNLEFYFDISNLFDESQRFVQSNNGVRNRTIVNGPFVSFGVNGRF